MYIVYGRVLLYIYIWIDVVCLLFTRKMHFVHHKTDKNSQIDLSKTLAMISILMTIISIQCVVYRH